MRPNRDAPGRVTRGGRNRRRTGGSGGPVRVDVARRVAVEEAVRLQLEAGPLDPHHRPVLGTHERGHVDALPKNDVAPGVLDAEESAGAAARLAPGASRHPGEVAAPHQARRGRRRLPHVCRALLRVAGPPLRAAGKRPTALGDSVEGGAAAIWPTCSNVILADAPKHSGRSATGRMRGRGVTPTPSGHADR